MAEFRSAKEAEKWTGTGKPHVTSILAGLGAEAFANKSGKLPQTVIRALDQMNLRQETRIGKSVAKQVTDVLAKKQKVDYKKYADDLKAQRAKEKNAEEKALMVAAAKQSKDIEKTLIASQAAEAKKTAEFEAKVKKSKEMFFPNDIKKKTAAEDKEKKAKEKAERVSKKREDKRIDNAVWVTPHTGRYFRPYRNPYRMPRKWLKGQGLNPEI